jgi:hypothetical protein
MIGIENKFYGIIFNDFPNKQKLKLQAKEVLSNFTAFMHLFALEPFKCRIY